MCHSTCYITRSITVVGCRSVYRHFGLRLLIMPLVNWKLSERFQTNTHLQIGLAMQGYVLSNLYLIYNKKCSVVAYSNIQYSETCYLLFPFSKTDTLMTRSPSYCFIYLSIIVQSIIIVYHLIQVFAPMGTIVYLWSEYFWCKMALIQPWFTSDQHDKNISVTQDILEPWSICTLIINFDYILQL